jgi:MFS family permease
MPDTRGPPPRRPYSLLGLASIFGGVLVGRVSDALGRRTVLAGSMAIVGLICLVIPLRLGALVVVYTIAYGLLMTGIGTVIVAYISDVTEPKHIGTPFGTITMSLGVSQLISPLIGGWLADRTGDFAVTYLVASAAGVTAGLVATLLPVNNRAGRPSRG